MEKKWQVNRWSKSKNMNSVDKAIRIQERKKFQNETEIAQPNLLVSPAVPTFLANNAMKQKNHLQYYNARFKLLLAHQAKPSTYYS
eukprot:scaffold29126_cov67-Cyclotella_meneghiniana.AAC.7